MAYQEFPSAYEPITNIVLVGSTGGGKSATGNTLLGEYIFLAKKSATVTTRKCEMYRAVIQDGPIIKVIDTPGTGSRYVYDFTDSLSNELINCLNMAKEGIHAVLFVLSLRGPIIKEDVELGLDTLQRIFGSRIFDYIIVVFTGGDELEDENYTLDDYMHEGCPEYLKFTGGDELEADELTLDDCPEFLTCQNSLRLCRGRKVLFDNRTNVKDKKAKQLQQLLAHVADIRKQNGGIPYTDKLRLTIKNMAAYTPGYEPITNIVLVGSIGHGKSATANSLLGEKLFISKKWGEGVTARCEMFRAAIQDGPIINVIDTPGIGFVKEHDSTNYINKEIGNCLVMAEEGIHAMLFVLSVRHRLAQEVEFALDTLQSIFGNRIFDYIIVVFTGGDELEDENFRLDDYMREGYPEVLTRLLRLSGGRKVLFDNKTYNKEKKAWQLKELLAHVADIKKKNSGIPYTYKTKELNDERIEGEMGIKVMKEMLETERERTMNKMMMTHIMEIALKENAASHKKEMDQLEDTLKLEDTETMNMMENAFQNDTAAKATLKSRLQQKNRESMSMMEKMMMNAFKICEATHEREMDQLKNTLQLNDSQTMNMMAQMSAAAHERKIHYQNMLPKRQFPGIQLECNIM